MTSREDFDILLSSINGIVNEKEILDRNIENLRKLNIKDGIENNEMINVTSNVSNYVNAQILKIKNQLLNKPVSNFNIEEIGRIVYLLELMLDCCGKSIDTELFKRGYSEPIEWGLITFSMDYVPIYQEKVEEYMKMLKLNI